MEQSVRKSHALVTSVDVPEREPLVDVPGLSKWLNVPEKTIYRWSSCGAGPTPSRIGRHLRWRPDDVERWIDEQAKRKPA